MNECMETDMERKKKNRKKKTNKKLRTQVR